MKISSLFALPALLMSLSALADITPSKIQDDVYRKLYPYFMDGCSAGQRVNIDGQAGRSWGHGVVFLKGACRDMSQGYPRISMNCAKGSDEIGLSADGQFKNMNWISVPGEDMFFYGGVRKDEVFTPERKEQLIQQLMKSDYFMGIVSKFPYTTEEQRMRDMAVESVPIDVGMTLGRQTLCQRVPLNKKQLTAVVNYYNDLNKFYFEDGHRYDWVFLSNNCGHTANNAFHAAGLMEKKKVDQKGLEMVSNISIPSNFALNLIRKTGYDKFPDLIDVLNDELILDSLMKFDVIPVQDGALTRFLPIHGVDQPSLNQVYDAPASKTTYVDLNIFNSNKSMTKDIFNEEKYSALQENLEAFQKVYEKNLQETMKLGSKYFVKEMQRREEAGMPILKKYPVEKVYGAYISYLQRKLSSVENNLNVLQ